MDHNPCVCLSEEETVQLAENVENTAHSVAYHQCAYWLSSKKTEQKFMKNPKYIGQPKPKLTMSVKIVIVGFPKSRKSTDKHVRCLSFPQAKRTSETQCHLRRKTVIKTDSKRENVSRSTTIEEQGDDHHFITVTKPLRESRAIFVRVHSVVVSVRGWGHHGSLACGGAAHHGEGTGQGQLLTVGPEGEKEEEAKVS